MVEGAQVVESIHTKTSVYSGFCGIAVVGVARVPEFQSW